MANVTTTKEDENIVNLPNKAKLVAAAFLILVSTSAGFVGGWLGAKSQGQTGNVNTAASQQVIDNESRLISQVAETVGESVVSINVTNQSTTGGFFDLPRPFEYGSAGTGIIISEDGVVVTNRHVVADGVKDVSVTLSDGTELPDVEIIGRTAASDPLDVAFLKIKDKKGKALKAAKLGKSSDVIVGQKVIAIGNALGQFQNTVTSGIISGFGRSVLAQDESGTDSLQNLFQTDAAINRGNSGGPLVNVKGEVIGINTAVAGGQAENIGFAIPIDDVQGLIESVLQRGKLERPFLGVRYINLTDDLAFEFGVEVKRGAFIVPGEAGQPSIIAGSPAEKAGLKERDVIIKVNDQTIDEKHSLVSVLGRYKVGEEVSLTIVRDKQEQQIKVTLETLKED